MTNALAALKPDVPVETQNSDVLGGGAKGPIESGAYDATIKYAYTGQSAKGAFNVTLVLDIEGKERRQTIYISNRAGKVTYNKDGKNYELPGYENINGLCRLVTNKPLNELNTEKKTVELYNFDLGKAIPTEVDMLTALVSQPITVGMLRVIEDKNALNSATGEYEPTGETRTSNEFSRWFRATDKCTPTEAASGVLERGAFIDQWIEKNTGIDVDRSGKNNKRAKNVSTFEKPPAPAFNQPVAPEAKVAAPSGSSLFSNAS